MITIESGDVVHFDLLMTGEGQVREDSTVDQTTWGFDTIYNLGGPVCDERAEPGDTLEVEVLALAPGPWGWTMIIRERGLSREDAYLLAASAAARGATAPSCLGGLGQTIGETPDETSPLR